MMEKPFYIHYTDYRKVVACLPKNAKVLHNHPGFWMIVRLPGLTWDAARTLFKDDLVGICEQKEYVENEEKVKQAEHHKIDAAFPTPIGCGKRGCVV